ncbi:MAG: methyltransferase domain-containing protein [Candidatus Heimdallarchaeota archaeon]|nr:methyltransferase domain-containing protein [Candidatus Heimdallarchaeota archaeon]
MTTNNDWLSVPAPDQWMTGWDKYHKKLLEVPEEQLKFMGFIAHPVQVVGSHMRGNYQNMNILELGCGDGRYACFLAKLGCNVYAIDALKSAVEITKKRAKVMGVEDRIKVELKDMDGWDIPKNKYDVIIAVQVLQYLFDRAIPRLKEIAGAVKSGGYVVYCGNIPPHFDTDPPIRFIYKNELEELFEGWTFLSFGQDKRLIRADDLRGYIWTVVRKPNGKEEKQEKRE